MVGADVCRCGHGRLGEALTVGSKDLRSQELEVGGCSASNFLSATSGKAGGSSEGERLKAARSVRTLVEHPLALTPSSFGAALGSTIGRHDRNGFTPGETRLPGASRYTPRFRSARKRDQAGQLDATHNREQKRLVSRVKQRLRASAASSRTKFASTPAVPLRRSV
jgi:hypothetical protein